MIVARIYGGLGNQLFQYAAARSLSLKLNEELILDTFEYKYDKRKVNREFELKHFNISARTPNTREEKVIKLYRNPLTRRIFNTWPLKLYREKKIYEYDVEFDYLNGDIFLDGYWQSYHYFSKIRDVLLDDLTPKWLPETEETDFINIAKKYNSVSVHVRRGDYINNKKANAYHGTCSIEYYKKSFEVASKKISDPVFLIFSDDLDWVRENIPLPKKSVFVENDTAGFSPCVDLSIMSSCKNHIIANSSFSWWGAWLGTSINKIVIYPKKWINDQRTVFADLHPVEWIALGE